jgi:calcium/calmodulin-dependent protein kinase I
MIETEVCILKRIRHPNIIQLFEMYEMENKIYLVMELITGGELFDEIVGRGTFHERDAAKVVQKILKAIEYLHMMGIVHRDLKPENLLLSDRSKNPEVKISDFGLSKIFNETQLMRTACGTPGYVAPEVLKRQGYGNEVDMWSLGVITYILLCGYPPFFDQNNTELFKKIMSGRFQFDRPWWDNISDKAKDFIKKLLVLDPSQRWSASQALRHPFIVDHCGTPETQRPVVQAQVQRPLPSKTTPTTTRRMKENESAPEPRPLGKKTEVDDSDATVTSQPNVSSQKTKATNFTAKLHRITSWFRSAAVIRDGRH